MATPSAWKDGRNNLTGMQSNVRDVAASHSKRDRTWIPLNISDDTPMRISHFCLDILHIHMYSEFEHLERNHGSRQGSNGSIEEDQHVWDWPQSKPRDGVSRQERVKPDAGSVYLVNTQPNCSNLTCSSLQNCDFAQSRGFLQDHAFG